MGRKAPAKSFVKSKLSPFEQINRFKVLGCHSPISSVFILREELSFLCVSFFVSPSLFIYF